MFLRLAREHPTLQRYWNELKTKGCIRNERGAITLKNSRAEELLIVKDVENGIRFTLRRDGLVVVRGYDSRCPTVYKFLLHEMPLLDMENPEIANEAYEGYECAVRDLKRAIREIIKKHRKSKGFIFRFLEWIDVKTNGYFFMFVTLYVMLTLVLISKHFF